MEIGRSSGFNRKTPFWAVGFFDDLRPAHFYNSLRHNTTGDFGIGAHLFATEAEAVKYQDGTMYTILDFYVRTEEDRDALISRQKAAQDRHAAGLEDWFK